MSVSFVSYEVTIFVVLLIFFNNALIASYVLVFRPQELIRPIHEAAEGFTEVFFI